MATVTIRVPQATHQQLHDMAERRGRPIDEIVDEAARKMEEADFWAEVNAAYERIYADPVAKADYETDLASMEGTVGDGLEDWPYERIEELLEHADAKNQASGT